MTSSAPQSGRDRPAFRFAPCGLRGLPGGIMKRKLIPALILFLAPLLVPAAHAFPDRPIKLVVSSPAGGAPDIMARLLSDRVAAVLGQPVGVENRPGGGGGTIGVRSVLGAEPDGHTLLMGSTSSLLLAPLIRSEEH